MQTTATLHSPFVSSLCVPCSQQMQGMVGVLESELRTAMAERDDALLQMRNAHEQAQQNATAVVNLQSVLEQFQRGIVHVRAGFHGSILSALITPHWKELRS